MVTKTRTGAQREAPDATTRQEEQRRASIEPSQEEQREPQEPISRAQFEELMKTMATIAEKVNHLTAKQQETEEPGVSRSSRPKRASPEGSKASWSEEEKESQPQPENRGVSPEGRSEEEQKKKGKEPMSRASRINDSPFTHEVLEEPLPPKFRMPMIEQYNGTTDPTDHIETYKSIMVLHQVPDEIMCRAFPPTLRGPARIWCSKLPKGSISSFDQFSRKFISHFVSKRKH